MKEKYETSSEAPKCYPMLLERFGGGPWEESDDCITYDGVIHSRHHPLPPDVLEHELVHIRQQAIYPGGSLSYLLRYCADDAFRMWQEIEAYRAQLKFIQADIRRWARLSDQKSVYEEAKRNLARDFACMYALELTEEQAYGLL